MPLKKSLEVFCLERTTQGSFAVSRRLTRAPDPTPLTSKM